MSGRAHRLGRAAAIGLATVVSAGGLGACGNLSAQTRGCDAKKQVLASVAELQKFNYTQQNASSLAGVLDSMRRGLEDAKPSVPAAESARLEQLGSQVKALVESLGGSGDNGQPIDVAALRDAVGPRVAEVQQIMDSVTGC